MSHFRKAVHLQLALLTILLPCKLVASETGINVKRYPVEMQQANSRMFAKCIVCHGLESTVYSENVLPSYFEDMVKRMQELPGSNMTDNDTKVISEFLIYDSYHRRNRELMKQLKGLPIEPRKEEVAKLKSVLNKYGDNEE